VGSRSALCGRRRLPNAERALYFGRLRNALSNTNWNSNGYTDSNCNRKPVVNTNPSTNCYATTKANAARTADSKTFGSDIASE
jgi:hypothetical protein